MAMDLGAFAPIGLTESELQRRIRAHELGTLPRLERMWAYYRNPMRGNDRDVSGGSSTRGYRLAQQDGLPARLRRESGEGACEAVIENDIGWRIDSMVDFVFGKPVPILSTARDEARRHVIERVLDAAWEASGGVTLFQDIALIGAVYGYVDLILRWEGLDDAPVRTDDVEALIDAARSLRVEIVEPRRMIPIVDPNDYRRLIGAVISARRASLSGEPSGGALGRLTSWLAGSTQSRTEHVLEIHSATHWRSYIDGAPSGGGVNPLGETPIVHIQNASQPFAYAGLSDVEPLIPLQDELNTRISDRAHRVTMQSFNMYLAKGLDGFGSAPIGPGQVWMTDNTEATVEAFGGDGDSPSEQRHIQEVREAMDKVSGVSPLAAGVLRERIGHLSSENALRVTLMGVLSKAARKRVSYGRGIAEMSRLMLAALDAFGVLKTDARDRGVRFGWADPLPTDEREVLTSAKTKLEIGVPRETVLAELGYAPTDPGVG